MKESKEAALKKLEAVCKSESFQHMSKEGLKSSFGEYNKDNSEINKIKYDYNNNSIAHGTDTPYDAQKAHHMTQKADLEWEQAVKIAKDGESMYGWKPKGFQARLLQQKKDKQK